MADGSDITKRAYELCQDDIQTQPWVAQRLLIELAAELERLRAQAPGWRGMESKPPGEALLYFPEKDKGGKNHVHAWITTGPGSYPFRHATHWQPLPEPPAEGGMCSPSGLGGPADKPTDV